MNLTLQTFNYSIFGNFKEILINIAKVKTIFSDGDLSVVPANLATSTAYLYKDSQMKVLIAANRIDFLYDTNERIPIEEISSFLKKISTQINFVITRIAFNCGMFIEDKDSSIVTKINSLIPFFNFNANASLNELLLRQNLEFKHHEKKFNDVLTIGNANMQNNKTFEVLKVCAFDFDINSFAGENYTFNLNELNDYFAAIYSKFNNRLSTLLKTLESVLER